MPIVIRRAVLTDQEQIWKIIQLVIAKGDTYAFDPGSSKEKMLAYWCGEDRYTYVAVDKKLVVGTFLIKNNQPDLGSHIANAAYMVSPEQAGRGIGKLMGEYSLAEAKKLGYRAMQFNLVIKSNKAAVQLWTKLGFDIIGEIPEAFNHAMYGLTNAYIFYKKL